MHAPFVFSGCSKMFCEGGVCMCVMFLYCHVWKSDNDHAGFIVWRKMYLSSLSRIVCEYALNGWSMITLCKYRFCRMQCFRWLLVPNELFVKHYSILCSNNRVWFSYGYFGLHDTHSKNASQSDLVLISRSMLEFVFHIVHAKMHECYSYILRNHRKVINKCLLWKSDLEMMLLGHFRHLARDKTHSIYFGKHIPWFFVQRILCSMSQLWVNHLISWWYSEFFCQNIVHAQAAF